MFSTLIPLIPLIPPIFDFFFKTIKGGKNIIGGVYFPYDLYNLAITDLVDELLYII